jgi:hypothetical protein
MMKNRRYKLPPADLKKSRAEGLICFHSIWVNPYHLTIHGIIQHLGGDAQIKHTLKMGTTFVIRLPSYFEKSQ